MVIIGSGAERPLESIKLSRYACYLTVQNAAPSKPLLLKHKHIIVFLLKMKNDYFCAMN